MYLDRDPAFKADYERLSKAASAPKDVPSGGPDIVSPERLPTDTSAVTGGGKRAPLASASEALAEPKEIWNNPRFTAPELEVKPNDSRTVAAGKEVWNIAKSLPEFMSSDMGLAS